MSVASAARKIGKGDLYRTPYRAIIPLKMALSKVRDSKILDPCEGDGIIKNALRSRTNSVIGFDLFPNHGVSVDFLKHSGKYDIISGNPPFSLKGDFIEHGLSISEYVIYILPMSVVSYNIFHRSFLDIPQYMGRILMTPKMFMNASGSFVPGGTDSYA